MIYTLEWLKAEAEMIVSHWNGKDAKFVDGDGEPRTEEDVAAAEELLNKIAEVEAIVKELGL